MLPKKTWIKLGHLEWLMLRCAFHLVAGHSFRYTCNGWLLQFPVSIKDDNGESPWNRWFFPGFFPQKTSTAWWFFRPTPLKKWWSSSTGRMTSLFYDGKKNSMVPNHQPAPFSIAHVWWPGPEFFSPLIPLIYILRWIFVVDGSAFFDAGEWKF